MSSKLRETIQKLETKMKEFLRKCGGRLQKHPRIAILFSVLIILAYLIDTDKLRWDNLSASLLQFKYWTLVIVSCLAAMSLLFGRVWLQHIDKSIKWTGDHWKILIPLIPLVLIVVTIVDYIDANRNVEVVSAAVVWPEGDDQGIKADAVAIQYQANYNNISSDGFEFSTLEEPAFIEEVRKTQLSPSLDMKESLISFDEKDEKCSNILTPSFKGDTPPPLLTRSPLLPNTPSDEDANPETETIQIGGNTDDDISRRAADPTIPIKTSVGTFDLPLRFLLPYIGYRVVNIEVTLVNRYKETEYIRIDVKKDKRDGGQKWSVNGPREDWLQLMKFLSHWIRFTDGIDLNNVLKEDIVAIKEDLALSLGNTSYQDKDYISALAYYRLAASFRPNNDTTQILLSMTQHQLRGDLPEFGQAPAALERYLDTNESADASLNIYLACMYLENDQSDHAQEKFDAFVESLQSKETPQQRMAKLEETPVIGPGRYLSVSPDAARLYYIADGEVHYTSLTSDNNSNFTLSNANTLPKIESDSSQDIGKGPRQVFATNKGVYYLTRDGLVYFFPRVSQQAIAIVGEDALFIDESNRVLSGNSEHLYTGGIHQIFAKDDRLFLVDRFGRVLRLYVNEATYNNPTLEAVGTVQKAKQIFLDHKSLYILRHDGTIGQVSNPNDDLKTITQLVSNKNNREIAAFNDIVFMLREDGIWRYRRDPKTESSVLIDKGIDTKGIFAALPGLFVLKNNGEVWLIEKPEEPTEDDFIKQDIQPGPRIALNATGSTLFALERRSDSESLGIKPYKISTSIDEQAAIATAQAAETAQAEAAETAQAAIETNQTAEALQATQASEAIMTVQAAQAAGTAQASEATQTAQAVATALKVPTSAPSPTPTNTSTPTPEGMVYIPADTFQMGSPDKQEDLYEFSHPVTLADFWIDQHEVTNAEYRECVDAQVCRAPHRPDEEGGTPVVQSATRPTYFNDPSFDSFPVIFVSWSDARDYCQWRGKRLPTEAEWEWAAKGPEGLRYPWGNEPPSPSLANYLNSNIGDTQSVMNYPPASAHKIYDMAGNVWEWTSSLYEQYPYGAYDGREDPAKEGDRVLRGGSWRDGDDGLRTTHRNVGTGPNYPLDNVGFRCVK